VCKYSYKEAALMFLKGTSEAWPSSKRIKNVLNIIILYLARDL
jgi:hypothetical protein